MSKLSEFVENKCKLDSRWRDEDGVLHDRLRPIISTHLPDLNALFLELYQRVEKLDWEQYVGIRDIRRAFKDFGIELEDAE